MRNSEAYPHLLDTGLLQGLDLSQKTAFIDACNLRFCADSTELLQQSEPAPGCFLIARGRVSISYLDDEGNLSIVHIAGPGEIVGEVEALGRRLCAASCTSLPDTTVLFCPAQLLMDYAQLPAVIRNIAGILHDRLVRDNHQRSVEQFYTVDERLFMYLRQFSTPDDPEIQISQAYLASLMGCSRQKMNRMLKALRDDGTIELSRGRIIILNRARICPRETAGRQDQGS